MTLLDHLRQAAAASPDKAAFLCGDARLSYAGLLARVEALAGWLQQHQRLKRGDRVLLVGASDPQIAVATYALWRAGAVSVPVNPMSTAAEIGYYAADSGARLALVDDALAERLAGAPAGAFAPHPAGAPADLQPLRVQSLQAAVCAATAAALPPHGSPVGDDAVCLLPYTSGTTGQPKGCLHTQATLTASLRTSARWRGFDAGTVFLGNTPLFHMQGLQNGMNLPLMLGATSVLQPRWHTDDAAALIERHRVSAWSAAPTMLVDLFASPVALRHDLSSLRVVSGGGAALPAPVAQALHDRLGLVYNEAYGLTETASLLHANPLGGGHRGCLGLATDGVDSRIVDPESGAELAHGETGELVTRAPQVMLGYWTGGLQPAADAAAWRLLDGHRFLRTGDLAHRDADGYFFLRDRLKRMINSAGFKVWPAEVEAALHRHPAVQEACVIAMHDARRGEAVMAVVVRRSGSRVDAAELIAWARDAMAAYKAPRAIEFRSELPRAATGKIAWRQLQAEQRQAEGR